MPARVPMACRVTPWVQRDAVRSGGVAVGKRPTPSEAVSEAIGPVLGIVQRVIAGWLADQAGVPRDEAQRNAARRR